jgi:hypothetical protein
MTNYDAKNPGHHYGTGSFETSWASGSLCNLLVCEGRYIDRPWHNDQILLKRCVIYDGAKKTR